MGKSSMLTSTVTVKPSHQPPQMASQVTNRRSSGKVQFDIFTSSPCKGRSDTGFCGYNMMTPKIGMMMMMMMVMMRVIIFKYHYHYSYHPYHCHYHSYIISISICSQLLSFFHISSLTIVIKDTQHSPNPCVLS